MRKRRNRICRRIAVALTVALLVGQSQALVLAEEDAGDALQTEISSEGAETDQQGEGDGQDKCICGTKCAEDAVNTDCPVCAVDSAACAGKADDEGNDDPGNDNTGDSDTENDNTENNNLENDGQDNTDSNPEENTDEPNRCVCETACAEDAVNADCPVCAADYVNCAKNAGGGVKPSVETAVPETASENMLDEEAGVAALADEGVEAYAVGDKITHDGIRYVITGDGEVEVGLNGDVGNQALIPASFTEGGVTYRVTSIGSYAFNGCSGLTSITIPEGVTSIGEIAFYGCSGLTSVTIPGSVTSIGQSAFRECSGLTSVTIPGSVKEMAWGVFLGCSGLTSVTIEKGVTNIESSAFDKCSSLSSVTIPEGVTHIGGDAFGNCSSLSSITIPEGVTYIGGSAFIGCSSLESVTIPKSYILAIGDSAAQNSIFKGCINLTTVTLSEKISRIPYAMFQGCTKLATLNILVEAGGAVGFPGHPGNEKIEQYAFDGCPSGRKIVFWDAEGKKMLTDSDWEQARDIYKSNNDGDTTDNFWYGWSLDEPPEAEDTHKVTITVQKDDSPWTDHNRTFALTKDSTTFVTDLDAVEAGTYTVYDVTGVAAGDFATKGMDTGVTVTVADTDASAIVEYYTVAFCYLDDDGNEQTYGDSTDWKPQTVLKTVGRVAEPATNPTKADHAFDKWVTAPNGETAFAFETTPITAKDTKIYAKWTENTVTTYHTVTFYDGTTPYGADTPQKPQSVAGGQTADKPEDPEKAGWEFTGWKTADGGSTTYDFGTPVTGDIGIYASWVKKTVTDSLRIKATATEGGTIAPKGEIIVSRGGERTFTITPDEGYRIKSVTVDDGDVTADLKETRARAQTGARYYTFTNIVKDHTIHAEFERDGGENPNPNPTPGGDGGNTNPDGGSGGSGGGSSSSGGGDNGGGDTDPDGGNGAGNTVDFTNGENTGNTQETAGTEISSAQAGSNAAGVSAGSNAAGVTTAGASGQTVGANGTATGGKEPKTGDTAYWEVYATLAMVAGLTYLLLYIMEESRGMTEREKEAAMAALIRWGKKGGAFRKCCAMAAIFGLLLYYHAIGKRAGGSVLRDRYLGQAF